MPYKAVGAAIDFFERGSEMASGSRRTRERLLTRDEALQQIFEDERGSIVKGCQVEKKAIWTASLIDSLYLGLFNNMYLLASG